MPAKTDLYDGIDLENNTHPHAIMGDFVKSYYELIKPALEKGDIKGVTGIIEDAYLNFGGITVGGLGLTKDGADTSFGQAISILHSLVEENKREAQQNVRILKKGLDSFIRMVNIEVSQLDIILQNDKVYEKHRQREEE